MDLLADDLRATVSGQALTLVFVDSTQGWINVQNSEDTETGTPAFIGATGGTITTSGNVHYSHIYRSRNFLQLLD